MVVVHALRNRYRPIYGTLLVACTVILLVLNLQGLSFLGKVELAAYDFHFGLRSTILVPNDIVVVGITDADIKDLGGRTPVSRHWLARAIDVLQRSGARAIGLTCVCDSSTTPGADRELERAMQRAGNVVLAETLLGVSASNDVEAYTQLDAPMQPLLRRAAGVGLLNYPYDPDGSVRADDPIQSDGFGHTYPSFDAAVAAAALHEPLDSVLRGLPTNHMLINFLGPQDPQDAAEQTFLTDDFESVVEDQSNPALFRNRIVLIVPESLNLNNIYTTPYGPMFTGILQANALNTILRRDPIRPLGSTGNSVIIVGIGLLTAALSARFRFWGSALGVLGLVVGYAIADVIAFSDYRVWANLVTPELAVTPVFAAVMAFRFATEERQRRRTRDIFGQYVKPEIVDMLVSTRDVDTALVGARRPVTVLFVDIRGFTAMSERLEPEGVMAALDVYLKELTECVQAVDGTLDKYIGDELMAIWNAPRFQPDHALLAIRAAVDMIERMEIVNAQLRDLGLPAVSYGVGINSGDAVVGQMGSPFRKQYDVVGDTVNTAARLCSAAGGGEVIIGEETWRLVGDRILVEETEPLPLKGKSVPMRTFTVLALEGQPVRSARHQTAQSAP